MRRADRCRRGIAARLAASVVVVLVTTTTAWAADAPLVSLGLGATDFLGSGGRAAMDTRLDYRSGLSLAPYFEDIVQVKAWAGLEGTSRGSLWAGGGIWLDIPIDTHWVLSPLVGVGYYDDDHGRNLGSVVQFRSQFEGGYVFDNGVRLVASIDHMSDAGITRHNPGTETAMIALQVPLRALLGL